MTAVVVTGMKNVRAVNEHYFRGLVGYDADGDSIDFGTGKGLAKYFGLACDVNNAPVAVVVKVYAMDRA